MESSDTDSLLSQLEEEERLVSKQRSRLHQRIEYLRTAGDGTGNPATPEQLEALDAQEREISTVRKNLHARIDQLRAEHGGSGASVPKQ